MDNLLIIVFVCCAVLAVLCFIEIVIIIKNGDKNKEKNEEKIRGKSRLKGTLKPADFQEMDSVIKSMPISVEVKLLSDDALKLPDTPDLDTSNAVIFLSQDNTKILGWKCKVCDTENQNNKDYCVVCGSNKR